MARSSWMKEQTLRTGIWRRYQAFHFRFFSVGQCCFWASLFSELSVAICFSDYTKTAANWLLFVFLVYMPETGVMEACLSDYCWKQRKFRQGMFLNTLNYSHYYATPKESLWKCVSFFFVNKSVQDYKYTTRTKGLFAHAYHPKFGPRKCIYSPWFQWDLNGFIIIIYFRRLSSNVCPSGKNDCSAHVMH